MIGASEKMQALIQSKVGVKNDPQPNALETLDTLTHGVVSKPLDPRWTSCW